MNRLLIHKKSPRNPQRLRDALCLAKMTRSEALRRLWAASAPRSLRVQPAHSEESSDKADYITTFRGGRAGPVRCMSSCFNLHRRRRKEPHAQEPSDLHHVLRQTSACRPGGALGVAKVDAQRGRRSTRVRRCRSSVHTRQALRQVAPVRILHNQRTQQRF